MSIYGINRVRGGTYNRIELTAEEIIFINKEIRYAKRKSIESTESDEWVWCCEYCEKEYDDEIKCERHEKYCKLCKQQDYYSKKFNKLKHKHIHGYDID